MTSSVSGVMTEAGNVVTGSVGLISNVIGAITDNPLIFVCVALPFVGLAIKLVKKLISVKAGRGA